MFRILLPIILILGLINDAVSQDCSPSLACFNAPLICGNSLDGLVTTTSGSNDITQPAEFCGVIENNQWIRFFACESTVTIGFEIFSCAGTFTGTGIQAEIFETSDCISFNSVSDCYSTSDASAGTLTATGLEAGQSYYLMVDGWAGDICQYQINVLSGIDTDPPTPQEVSPGEISGPTVVCPDETVTYTAILPECNNTSNSGCPLPTLPPSDFTFEWDLPSDASLVSQDDNEITVSWGAVGGTIEVSVSENNSSSSCDCNYSCGTDIPSINVVVDDMPDIVTTLPTVYACEGDTYYFCGEGYTETIDAMCSSSCQTAEIQPIVFLEVIEVNLGIITNCNGDCFEINGSSYCGEGDFSVSEESDDGCQTTSFTIQNVDLSGFADGGEILTPTVTSTEISANGYSSNDPVSYEWSGPGIDATNMNEQNPTVNLPGTYTVTITDASGECSIEDTVIVFQQEDDCNIPVPPADDCESAPIFCGEQLNGYCSHTVGTSGNSDAISNAFCAPVEQSQYLKFVACETSVSLELNVPACLSGTGIEAGLFSGDCQNLTPLSNCGEILLEDTLILTANSLIPGEIYFLVVDGIAGAECTWEVEILEGISTDPIELDEISEDYIEGDEEICRGDTAQYTLFPKQCALSGGCAALSSLTDSFYVRWYFPPEAIVVDSTGLNLSLAWPSGSGGEVTALFISAFGQDETYCGNEVSCSGTAEFYTEVLYDEITLSTVYLCEGESYEFCGEIITETATRTCQDECDLLRQTVEFSSPTIIELDTIKLCPGDCYELDGTSYCEEGYYEIETVNGVCPDIYKFNIEIINEPEISIDALETSCDGTGTNYIVGFDITNGIEPFYLNGIEMENTSFVSNPILSEEPYDYMITDSRICGSDVELVMGVDTCACTSYAGTMAIDTLFACLSNEVSAVHLGDEVMDLDDNFEYILHASNVDTLGEIFAISKEPEFSFLNTMTLGEIYYISYVVANEIDGGFIDLSDRCLSVSAGQAVVWYAEPSIEIPILQTLDCANPAITLNANANIGSEFAPHYEWTFPDGEISTELNQSITQSGFYSLLIIDPKTGCTASDDVTVFEDFSIPEVSITGNLVNCANPSTEVSVSTNLTNFTLLWADQNDTPLGNDMIITGSFPNIYTANIIGENGCLGSDDYEIIGDFTEPEISVTGGILDCYNPSLQLQSSTNIPNPEYSWTSEDFSSDLAQPIISTEGFYNLTITNPENGCDNEAVAEVENIIAYPEVLTSVDSILTCSVQSVSLSGLGTSEGSNYNYQWTSNSDLSIENSMSLYPTVFAAGLYELNVFDMENGCSSSAQVEVEQETDIPVNLISSISPPTCHGDEDAIFSVVQIEGGITPYSYTFTGFETGENTDWYNLAAGNYTIQILDANDCILKEDIVISNPPLVSVDLGPDRNLDYGESVILSPNFSIDPFYLSWQSNDLQSFTEREWEVSPFYTTDYEIEISDENNCTDRDTVKVIVNREIPIFVPTAFSPNNDGNNDVFFVNTANGVAEINQMDIFDRWGNQVYSNKNFLPNDPNLGWNGRYNGQQAATGVYVWYLSLSLTDGTVLELAGDVSILR